MVEDLQEIKTRLFVFLGQEIANLKLKLSERDFNILIVAYDSFIKDNTSEKLRNLTNLVYNYTRNFPASDIKTLNTVLDTLRKLLPKLEKEIVKSVVNPDVQGILSVIGFHIDKLKPKMLESHWNTLKESYDTLLKRQDYDSLTRFRNSCVSTLRSFDRSDIDYRGVIFPTNDLFKRIKDNNEKARKAA